MRKEILLESLEGAFVGELDDDFEIPTLGIKYYIHIGDVSCAYVYFSNFTCTRECMRVSGKLNSIALSERNWCNA